MTAVQAPVPVSRGVRRMWGVSSRNPKDFFTRVDENGDGCHRHQTVTTAEKCSSAGQVAVVLAYVNEFQFLAA